MTSSSTPYAKAIACGGLLVGVLDGLAAVLTSAAAPMRVFQSIASGLLGRDAYQGGLAAAALGLVLHFFIATSAAAVFVVASRRLPVLVRAVVPCGIAYGVAVFAFMNLVVIPLTFGRLAPYSLPWLLRGLLIHALFVGLPIGLCTRRFAAPVSDPVLQAAR
ncbi:MAG: hypothetical protein AB7O37_20395 [Vicinamibacteria bacterium]